jgi:hypothetical protein
MMELAWLAAAKVCDHIVLIRQHKKRFDVDDTQGNSLPTTNLPASITMPLMRNTSICASALLRSSQAQHTK